MTPRIGFRYIRAEIRYLTPEEGGRQSPIASGYRGQFHYVKEGDDWDGFQYFPDFGDDTFVPLGTTVTAFVEFAADRWNDTHRHRILEGMPFHIREGSRVVGRGVV